MLSLTEQLMLLALHDEKGSVIFSSSTALPYGLAGAMLLDLYFKKKIILQDNKVQVVDTTPTGDAMLDEALVLIQSSAKNRSIKHWVGKINSKIKGIKQRTVERLVVQNILKQEEHRFLWFFNVNRYPTLNAAPELEIRNKIRNIVLHDYSTQASKAQDKRNDPG